MRAELAQVRQQLVMQLCSSQAEHHQASAATVPHPAPAAQQQHFYNFLHHVGVASDSTCALVQAADVPKAGAAQAAGLAAPVAARSQGQQRHCRHHGYQEELQDDTSAHPVRQTLQLPVAWWLCVGCVVSGCKQFLHAYASFTVPSSHHHKMGSACIPLDAQNLPSPVHAAAR